MFEKASRIKLRFNTPKGLLTTEDLWDLPLTSTTGKANLDDIARALHVKLKTDDTMSFVEPAAGPDKSEDQLAFQIVVHVIKTRQAEAKVIAEAKERKEKKQKLMALIERKQDAALENLGVDELQKLLESL